MGNDTTYHAGTPAVPSASYEDTANTLILFTGSERRKGMVSFSKRVNIIIGE